MAYATGDDLVARFDIDLVGDLASDERKTLERAEVLTHPVVLMALSEASGEVDAALRVFERYKPEDLANLTGTTRDYLAGIVCNIAMVRLYNRRAEAVPDNIKAVEDRAKAALEALRRGDNILGLPDQEGTTIHDTDGPTPIEIQHRNDMTARMRRYFPQPVSRLPTSQGGGYHS